MQIYCVEMLIILLIKCEFVVYSLLCNRVNCCLSVTCVFFVFMHKLCTKKAMF